MFPFPYGNMAQNQLAYEQSLKNIIEQANGQLQQIQNQPPIQQQQPTNLTQNFQFASNNNSSNLKVVNGLEEVQKEIVLVDTYFIDKQFKNMWIKNPKGDMRIFAIEEIIPKDEKDIMIEQLQKEIQLLKGDNINANREYSQPNGISLYEQPNDWNDESVGNKIATDKSAGISTISTSKTTKRKS